MVEKSLSADAVIRRLVFSDDFNRTVGHGLGGRWVYNGIDSNAADDSDPSTWATSVDGSSAVIVAPEAGTYAYESYTGFPFPQNGELAFDFWVPPDSASGATYAVIVDSWQYYGFIIEWTPSGWAAWTWHADDTPHSFSPSASTWYRARISWTQDAIRWRIWPRSSAEPTTWDVTVSATLWANRRDPFFDFYYSPEAPEPGKIDNFEVWSYDASWPNYYALNAGAWIFSPLVSATMTANAVINRPAGQKYFYLDAFIPYPSLTASAVVYRPASASKTADAFIYKPIPVGDVGISIKLDGVDITDDVLFSDAEFMSQASGSPGTCRFRVKDLTRKYNFSTGKSLTLDIDGVRVWGGWATRVGRKFFFPTTIGVTSAIDRRCIGDAELLPRQWDIEGADYNLLFRKRFVVRKDKPTDTVVKSWPEDTADDVMIRWLCEKDLYLEGDGIDIVSMVEHVGTPNPDARGNPASAGWSWEQAMRAISRLTGGIFYIDPSKRLVYTDVDTPSSGWVLTDDPQSPVDIGYREMEILHNGSNLVNDAMVWGAGQGATSVRFARTRDQTSINEHGLWQVGDFRTDMYRQTSVQKRADSFVYGSPQNKRGGKDDAVSFSATVFVPDFNVAQKVQVVSTVFGFSDVMPIRRMRTTFPTTKRARFDLVLSHAIDEPWNTFEFWFPPIPKPEIDIDITGDTLCPAPVLPSDQTAGDIFPSMKVVFSDDFATRDSGQIPDTTGGWWTNASWVSRTNMVFTDGAYTLTSNPLYLELAKPLTNSFQIILKLDFSGWTGYSSSLEDPVFEVSADGTFPIGISGKGKLIFNSALSVLPIDPRQKIFMRILVNREMGYTAIKVWPQAEVEPAEWARKEWVLPPEMWWRLRIRDSFSGFGTRKVEALTFWGNSAEQYGIGNDDALGSTAYPQVSSFGSSYPITGWRRIFDCSGNKSGQPFTDDTVLWDTDSLDDNGNGSTAFSAVADYYNPNKGHIYKARADTAYMRVYGYLYPNYYSIPTPDRVSLKGVITVGGGLALGIASARVTQNISITAELYVVPQSADDPNTAPYFYPYSAQGNVVFTGEGSFTISNTSGGSAEIPFEVSLPYNTYVNPFGYDGQYIQYGVRIQNPELLISLDYSGGPFMMSNTAGISATVEITDVGYDYNQSGSGTYFCTPVSDVDTDGRTCARVDVNPAYLQHLYAMGEPWILDIGSAYVASSVTVTADGTDMMLGKDFVETSPETGLITFMHMMASVAEIVVCYLPSTVS
jgi:hypothetical protein